ncbi:17482_t:CDS:2 [Funneliformis geosporum]|nr:17482_t:CDS:2 [Funneliformis geosporum]
MAGDVAQCIARGSSFRFQDLYALMYQRNIGRVQTDNNLYNPLKPKQFELNVNYRSHNGILRLASSVIQLIQHFFPDSIDKLSPEYGEIDGPQPLVFEGYQANTLFTTDISDKNMKKKDEDTYIEFGAKKRVVGNISDIGLVLTVFEAKGLEFNDVLLYDFFSDSPARSNVCDFYFLTLFEE